MIKTKELRKKSNEELNEMLKNLEMDLMRERCGWTRGNPEEKALRRKGGKLGQKTSLQRNIKRLTAKIKTIQNERKQ